MPSVIRAIVPVVLALAACTTAPAPETTRPAPLPPGLEQIVGPAVAAVTTPTTAGSAILVEPGTLVTSAHVVWPYDRVDVRLGDRPAVAVDVIRIDWVADLAVLDTTDLVGLPTPLPIGASIPGPGDPIFAVGRSAPDGTGLVIEEGSVTGTRTWEAFGLTLVETDIEIADGQSGGAVTGPDGTVLGLTGLSDRGLALAVASPDLVERLDRPATDGPGDRRLDALLGPAGETVEIRHLLDEAVYLLEAAGPVGLTAPGPGFAISVIAPEGAEEARSTGGRGLTLSRGGSGPRFVVVTPLAAGAAEVDLQADAGTLRPLLDPDHGRTVAIGDRIVANGDYPGDLDWFTVHLDRGDRVEIVASSINIDPMIVAGHVDTLGPDTVQVDSDTGGGPLGWDARLLYLAVRSGIHVVAVLDESRFGPGAYMLHVTAAP